MGQCWVSVRGGSALGQCSWWVSVAEKKWNGSECVVRGCVALMSNDSKQTTAEAEEKRGGSRGMERKERNGKHKLMLLWILPFRKAGLRRTKASPDEK